jgi:mono/diheme cytochrome c family protein
MRLVPFVVALFVGCGGEGKQLPRERATDPGAALFNAYAHADVKCYECHGGDGAGTKWGPALAQRVPTLDDDRLRRAIVEGKGKMPAFRAKLSDDEVTVLVGWLRAQFDRSRATETPAGTDECARDDDCVVTNFAGCCACPQCSSAAPYATTQQKLAADQATCAKVDCAPSPECDVGGMCPPSEPAENFVARCRDRRCAADRRQR